MICIVTRPHAQREKEKRYLMEITNPAIQLHPKGRPSFVQQKGEFRFKEVLPPSQGDRDSIENHFIPMDPNCPTTY
jgi:hypothetical protein